MNADIAMLDTQLRRCIKRCLRSVGENGHGLFQSNRYI